MSRSVPHSLKLMLVGLHGANRELLLKLYFWQSPHIKPLNISGLESLSLFSCVLPVTYTFTPPMACPYMNYQCHCQKVGSFLLMIMMIFAQSVRMVVVLFFVMDVLGPFTGVSNYLASCVECYSLSYFAFVLLLLPKLFGCGACSFGECAHGNIYSATFLIDKIEMKTEGIYFCILYFFFPFYFPFWSVTCKEM